jgi:hypothetical protein
MGFTEQDLAADSGLSTRPAAVAGSFYPADPAELARVVDACLAQARGDGSGGAPKALVAPHAGYAYSGPIAGSAFGAAASLRGVAERVVLLGPAHFVPVDGIAASSAGAFRTPLGDVPVDAAAVARALRLPWVAPDDGAHAGEHSLEVELPFLQRVLGAFALAPFAVGAASAAQVAALLEALWGGPETLVVISSDLSHYHDARTARRLDAATARAIEALDEAGLGPESACGRVPLSGLLVAARQRGLRARRLDLRNSGDTAGGRDEVVGYGAWAFER